MKGFLWSRKSSTSSASKNTSNNNDSNKEYKETRKFSAHSHYSQHGSDLPTSHSSSSLSSLTHGILSGRSNSNMATSNNNTPQQNNRQSMAVSSSSRSGNQNNSNSTAQPHLASGHSQAHPNHQSSRKSSIISKESYLRNSSSQPIVSISRKNNSLMNLRNHSTTSVVSRGSTHLQREDETGSILSEDLSHNNINTTGLELNINKVRLAESPTIDHDVLTDVAPDRNTSVISSGITASDSNTITSLNNDNYDSNIFKSGWLNRSHGQITINNPNYNPNALSPVSSSSMSSDKASKRESRMFHNGSTELLISNPQNIPGNNDMSIQDVESFNQQQQSPQPQQIVVPDYRLYKAQLRGSLFSLYKNGIGNNIKCFDPNLPPPEDSLSNNSQPDDFPAPSNNALYNNTTTTTSNNNNNINNKRATISGSVSSPSSSNSTIGVASTTTSRQNPSTTKIPIKCTSINAPITLTYLNDKFPHPDLTIDKHTGKITNGTLESLCHAVLFYNQEEVQAHHNHGKANPHINIFNILLMLPLINNLIDFLITFNQFGLTFTRNNSKVTINATQYFNISNELDDLLTERLALVVKTILDVFPGFLLNDKVFQGTITLLDTISLHNDEISNNLKISVANKHNDLNKLTYFIRPNSTDKNGNLLRVNPKLMNDMTDINKFLLLDTKKFASDIHSINLKFDKVWAPRFDYSLLYSSKHINTDIIALNPLVFNNSDNIHFLGRLLISHLFPSHTVSSTTRNNNSASAPRFNTDARTRAKVLVKWVQLGCRLEHLGDMVSWLTIATIICSVPILRLAQSWQYVPESILKIIFKDWVPTIVQLDRRQMSSKSTSSVFILAPPNLEDPYIRENVISYFGDLLVIADDLPADSTLKYLEKKITRTKNAFHKWQQRLEAIDDEIAKKGISLNETNIREEVDAARSPLYQFWKYHISQPKLNIKKIMQISLEYEPPLVNQNDYSTIGHHRSALLTGSYLPVVFNEVLPNYTLFPRSSLIGAAGNLVNKSKLPPPRSSARLSKALLISEPIVQQPNVTLDFDSNPITGVENIDGPLLKELMATQSTKQILMKSIRDVFNIDMDVFHISNCLIFKTSMETIEHSRRPASVVIESPRRFSQHSPKLNLRDSIDTTGRLSKTLENLDFFKDNSNTSDPLKASIIDVVVKSASLDKLFDLLVLTAGIFSKLIDTKDLENYCYHQQESSTNTNNIGLLDFALAKLAMDNDTFTETFFNTYKSFTTTLNVLENLAKRFIGAKSCALSVFNVIDSDDISLDNDIVFPVWDADVSEVSDVKTGYMINIQIGTAEAILHLITDHYTDLTDDIDCHTTMLDILKIMEQEIIVEWPKRIKALNEKEAVNTDKNKELDTLLSQFTGLFNNIKSHYQKQLYRPVGVSKMKKKIIEQLSNFKTLTFNEFNDVLDEGHSHNKLFSDFKSLNYKDYSGIFEWVSKMDKIFTDVFILATKQDWITTYEYLELLSKDSLTSFFAYSLHDVSKSLINTGSSQLKDMQISNVFNWISTLVDKNNEPIIQKLPQTIQMLFTLHRSLTNFFIAQIIDIHKQFEDRINNCTLILQILNYTRWKNASLDLFNSEKDGDIFPHVPSFIESAICNSIVSAESRYFEYAWSLAGYNLSPVANRKQGKSIKDIIDNIDPVHIRGFLEIDNVYTGKISRNFCPCPGWFVSRLLDISQFVPNMDTSNSKLINFDKRRFVNNIVSNVFNLVPNSSKLDSYNNLDTFSSGWASALFNQIEEPKNAMKKRAKSIAQDEVRAVNFHATGLFNDIVSNEVDKIRREEKKLDLLKAQENDNKLYVNMTMNANASRKRATISNHSLTSSPSNSTISSHIMVPAGNKIKRNSVAPTSSRNNSVSSHSSGSVSKKIGGFFKRPFSIAGFNTSVSNYSLNSSLQDANNRKTIQPTLLPEIENNELVGLKPILTLKTFDIKNIMGVINHKNNLAYSYSFKIIMKDGDEYMIQAKDARDLNEWIKMLKASKRYSFYSQKFRGKTHNKVFGVPLECICEREGTLVPTIVVKLLEEIELRGLDEVGLYRIPGSVGSINALKNAFDEEGAVNTSFTLEDDRWFEINAIAGCFKMYLRELPDSLFSTRLEEFASLVLNYKANNLSYDDYRLNVTDLLSKLPTCYYQTMKRIVFHLNKVHQHVGNNRMDASNLAIVFSMSFIDQDDLARSMGSILGAIQTILQQFIKTPEAFFV